MGKQKIQFKLDTGAEVTAMSDLSYRKLQKVCMSRASRVLFGPDHTHLDVLGQFSQTLAYGERKSKQQVFVVKGLKNNLLGLPAIKALELAARLDSTDSYQARIIAEYPSVFKCARKTIERLTLILRPNLMLFLHQDEYPTRFKTKFRRSYLEWSPWESSLK